MAGVVAAMGELSVGSDGPAYPPAGQDGPAERNDDGVWVYGGNPNDPPSLIDDRGACTWLNEDGRMHRGGGAAAYIPQDTRDGYFIDGVEFEWGTDEEYQYAEREYDLVHGTGRLTKAAGR